MSKLPVSGQRVVFQHFRAARWSRNSNGCFVDLSTASAESLQAAKRDVERLMAEMVSYDTIQEQHRTHVDYIMDEEPEVNLVPREEALGGPLQVSSPVAPPRSTCFTTLRRFVRPTKYYGHAIA